MPSLVYTSSNYPFAKFTTIFSADVNQCFQDVQTFFNTTKLDNTNIQTGGLIGANLANGTITTTQIASATILGSNIAAGTITGSLLNAAIVDNSTIQLSANTLSVKSQGITATQIANATITGTQLVNSIDLPSVPTAGSRKITVGIESGALYIIRGTVNADGTTSLGTGFSSSKTATGIYSVSFSPTFGSNPSIVTNTTNGQTVSNWGSASTSGFNVTTFASGSASDQLFSFIAIGQR